MLHFNKEYHDINLREFRSIKSVVQFVDREFTILLLSMLFLALITEISIRCTIVNTAQPKAKVFTIPYRSCSTFKFVYHTRNIFLFIRFITELVLHKNTFIKIFVNRTEKCCEACKTHKNLFGKSWKINLDEKKIVKATFSVARWLSESYLGERSSLFVFERIILFACFFSQ